MRRRRLASIVGAFSHASAGLVVAGALPAVAGPAHPIVVSPSGNDHNHGTQGKPLKTLAAAQAMARASVHAGRSVTVELKDGTYPLDKPLRFTAQDSGTSANPVVWTAARGAHPVVSGGACVIVSPEVEPRKNMFLEY